MAEYAVSCCSIVHEIHQTSAMTGYGFQVGPQSTRVKAHHTKDLLVEECSHHPHKFRYTLKFFMPFFFFALCRTYGISKQVCKKTKGIKSHKLNIIKQLLYYYQHQQLRTVVKEVSHKKKMHKAQTNYKNCQDINPPWNV